MPSQRSNLKINKKTPRGDIMARIKDLILDIQTYNKLNLDEQKRLREVYNLTIKDVEEIRKVLKTEAGTIGGE